MVRHCFCSKFYMKRKKLYGQLPNWILFVLAAIVVLCLGIQNLSLPLYARIIICIGITTGLYLVIDKIIGLTAFVKSIAQRRQRKINDD